MTAHERVRVGQRALVCPDQRRHRRNGRSRSNTALPSISGTPQDNQTLTRRRRARGRGRRRSPTPTPWLRCDASGANCAANGGPTPRSYRRRLRATSAAGCALYVTATNSTRARTTASSDPTNVVTAAGGATRRRQHALRRSISGTAQDSLDLDGVSGRLVEHGADRRSPISGSAATRTATTCVSDLRSDLERPTRCTSADVGHRLCVSGDRPTNGLGSEHGNVRGQQRGQRAGSDALRRPPERQATTPTPGKVDPDRQRGRRRTGSWSRAPAGPRSDDRRGRPAARRRGSASSTRAATSVQRGARLRRRACRSTASRSRPRRSPTRRAGRP